MISPSRKVSRLNSLQSTSEKPLERKQRFHYDHLGREMPPLKNPKPTFKDLIRHQILTFLLMMAKRERTANLLKQQLFLENKINLLSLFHLIDINGEESVGSDSLREYFSGSGLVTGVYGQDGRMRFSDFVRMLVPISYDLDLIEIHQKQPLDLEVLQRIIKVFNLVDKNEKQNVQELAMIKRELKIEAVASIFEGVLVEGAEMGAEELRGAFQEQNVGITEEELCLLVFKMDKRGRGRLGLRDFRGYF